MKNCRKNQLKGPTHYHGYSLIEGIFATFIVTVGMVAVVQLMTANLTVLERSRNQTVATLLAQEGMEIVRNFRDNSWAQGMLTFNNPNFPAINSNCAVDMYSTDLTNCNGSVQKRLRLDPDTGEYLVWAGSSFPGSMFYRKVTILYDTNDKTTATLANIVSVVIWTGSNIFPAPVDSTTCNQSTRCAFTKLTLNKWGGND